MEQQSCLGGRLVTAIFLIGLLGAAPVPIGLAQPPKAASVHPVKKITNDDAALWHYHEGLRLKSLGQIDDAMAQWDEALRLKPGYKDAQQALQDIENASIAAMDEVSKSEIPKIKIALKKFARADTFDDLADVMTDRSATDLSADLLYEEREAIKMLTIDPPAKIDATMSDEFGQYVLQNRLYVLLPQHSSLGSQEIAPQYDPVVTGRPLLADLAGWAARLGRSKVELSMARPYHIAGLANRVDDLRYAVQAVDWVTIDGTNCSDHVPLEARREDGVWRIGARDGWKFHYGISIKYHPYVAPAEHAPA